MSESTPGTEPTPEPAAEPTPTASTPPSGSSSSSSSTSASDAAATLKGADRLDLATIGAGVLVFLASLMPYYTVSVEGFGGDSANAWHGFFGWFGALCALAGAGVLVAKILGVTLPVPVRTTVLALFGLAAVCTLLALFVTPGGGCDDSGFGGEVCDMIDQGHGFGYWLALLASIAGVALAAVRRSAD
ncbi:hypothetical protein [Nocardioides astragali]|uniref:Uncharacterized protein n=1 Tax=Nocardioides astragali TaxID=1776736 RepID=A0ABW2MYZ2_9ACTN|nr:hypothetical protein [Nocardioides astragali]